MIYLGDKENLYHASLLLSDQISSNCPPGVGQNDKTDMNPEKTNSPVSNWLSPPTAIRSIVNELFEQHKVVLSPVAETQKRKCNKGLYGEEITSSNMFTERCF